MCRQRECANRQRVQAGECERRGDGFASRGSVPAEGVCRQRECAGGGTHRDKSAHGDNDGLGPWVVSGHCLEFHED